MSEMRFDQCHDIAYLRKDRGGTMPERFWTEYPCPHPAKYRLVPIPDRSREPEQVCGVHVRAYRNSPNVTIEALP